MQSDGGESAGGQPDEASLTGRELIQAVKAGDEPKVQALLNDSKVKEFIDQLDVGRHHVPALTTASVYGRTAIVKLLLEKGANPHFQDSYGITPLVSAATNNHLGTVTLLLDAGANPNTQTKMGETALINAAGN